MKIKKYFSSINSTKKFLKTLFSVFAVLLAGVGISSYGAYLKIMASSLKREHANGGIIALVQKGWTQKSYNAFLDKADKFGVPLLIAGIVIIVSAVAFMLYQRRKETQESNYKVMQ
jgi:hypothetical protein